MKEKVSTRLAEMWIDGENLLHVTYHKKLELSLDDAIEDIRDTGIFTEDYKRPSIVDISKLNSVTIQARRYFASQNAADVYKCVALITGSPVSSVIANFFLSMSKPKMPVKSFKTKEDGIRWARQYL